MSREAERLGYETIFVEAHEDKTLAAFRALERFQASLPSQVLGESRNH
jgi:hypothetical protein